MSKRSTCPEHNITDCATCYTNPGQCQFAGRSCHHRSTHTLVSRSDTRHFCAKHATDPMFAAMRIGYVLEVV